jgi:hypothetical protein
MLCHALQSYHRSDIELPDYQGISIATIQLYRVRAAQCLAIAGFTKPVKFMIEAMVIYSMAEYADESDGDMGTWLVSGYILRLALQQGYHRDPSQHPNISVFDGEMRRRLWYTISAHELLFSVKIGLPKAIRYSESDTRPPSNLHDDQLYEDMKVLPPSRPITEQTDITYVVIKCGIMRAYGDVIEFLHIVQPQPYEEVLRLDSMLMEAFESIPPHYQFRSFKEMQNDSSSLIMERCMVQMFCNKAVCLLHRKYWNAEPSDRTGLSHYSRERCVRSSIAILNQQAGMHHECQAGGSLSDIKWYHFAITNHDFLLAAMIICLDLMMANQGDASQPSSFSETIEKLNAIKRSRSIWSEIVDCCRDARRALAILSSVLNKLSDAMEETQLTTPATSSNSESLWAESSVSDHTLVETPLLVGQPYGDDIVMQEELVSSGQIFDTLVSDPNLRTGFDWVSLNNIFPYIILC